MTSEEIKQAVTSFRSSETLQNLGELQLRIIAEIAYQLAVGNEREASLFVRVPDPPNAESLAASVRAGSETEVRGGCPHMNRPCAFCGRPWSEHRDGQLVDALQAVQDRNKRTTRQEPSPAASIQT